MSVRFDTSSLDAQLNLADRKYIAMRLLRLLALEATKEGGREVLDGFIGELDLVMRNTLRDHLGSERGKPVDNALTTVRDEVNRRLIKQQSSAVSAGLQSIGTEVGRVKCSECSKHKKRTCGGTFRDLHLFEGGDGRDGGLCVNFVRELVLWLRKKSEAAFQKHSGGLELRAAPREVTVRMDTLPEDHDGTLPMDGSFDPDVGHLSLKWPADPNDPEPLDEAILMLPYLIFHEMFVHGGQGRALGSPIDEVLPQCAFTEGAVDAAGRRFLMTFVLGDDADTPEQFIALRSDVMDRTERYGVKRNNMPKDDEGEPVRKSINRRIRRARAEGTIKIWKKLEQIETLTDRPKNWAIELMIRLNLLLDTDQRDEFVFSSEYWDVGQQSFRDGIAYEFDEFLRSNNTLNLLKFLDRLKCG